MMKYFYRRLARWRMVRRYKYLNEVNKILEEYLTSKILRGGSAEFLQKGRNDLVKSQNEIKEQENFIEFLKKTK
jgi:hypothetical protein